MILTTCLSTRFSIARISSPGLTFFPLVYNRRQGEVNQSQASPLQAQSTADHDASTSSAYTTFYYFKSTLSLASTAPLYKSSTSRQEVQEEQLFLQLEDVYDGDPQIRLRPSVGRDSTMREQTSRCMQRRLGENYESS